MSLRASKLPPYGAAATPFTREGVAVVTRERKAFTREGRWSRVKVVSVNVVTLYISLFSCFDLHVGS